MVNTNLELLHFFSKVKMTSTERNTVSNKAEVLDEEINQDMEDRLAEIIQFHYYEDRIGESDDEIFAHAVAKNNYLKQNSHCKRKFSPHFNRHADFYENGSSDSDTDVVGEENSKNDFSQFRNYVEQIHSVECDEFSVISFESLREDDPFDQTDCDDDFFEDFKRKRTE